MANTPPQPPSPDRVSGWLNAAKGLTVTNAIVVLLLVLALVPAYAVYKFLTDDELLDRFLSEYRVIAIHSPCILRKAREKGEPHTWAVTTFFAAEGNTRWSIGIVLASEPTVEEIGRYCDALLLLVDKLREPSYDEGRR